MSAIADCRVAVIARRRLPTRREHADEERQHREREERQSPVERDHRDVAATTVVTFWVIDVAVVVTTFCTPPMSLAIRDCTSPVRVRVKKASDSRCRWS